MTDRSDAGEKHSHTCECGGCGRSVPVEWTIPDGTCVICRDEGGVRGLPARASQ